MVGADPHAHLKQEFERIFRADGFENVRQRSAVLDAFLSAHGHVTAHDLAQQMRNAGISISESDVQRTLELFVRYAIARRVQFEGHPVRYEHLHLDHRHGHLICVKCGAIAEIDDNELAALRSSLPARHGFRSLRERLEIYGVCAKCDRSLASHTFPLVVAAAGQRVQIASLPGGRAMEQRLHSMGVREGMVVEILQQSENGPVIVAYDETRLAIDQDIARRLLVRAVEGRAPGDKPTPSRGIGWRFRWNRER